PARAGWIERRAMRAASRDLLAQVNLDVDPRVTISDLSLSQQQLVEIARALSAGARLLIMDEPSSSLTDHETRRLLELVRQLRTKGVAILYVSHRMAEGFAVADRITVYRDGAYVDALEPAGSTAGAGARLLVGG